MWWDQGKGCAWMIQALIPLFVAKFDSIRLMDNTKYSRLLSELIHKITVNDSKCKCNKYSAATPPPRPHLEENPQAPSASQSLFQCQDDEIPHKPLKDPHQLVNLWNAPISKGSRLQSHLHPVVPRYARHWPQIDFDATGFGPQKFCEKNLPPAKDRQRDITTHDYEPLVQHKGHESNSPEEAFLRLVESIYISDHSSNCTWEWTWWLYDYRINGFSMNQWFCMSMIWEVDSEMFGIA